ncbi:citrate/2-methylcitrate synthase [Secundilactobacillus collinoides]|uniref:Citrate synthase n=2 Tax=Secundilactobacillus collinoides TaxID=33960 RepID=A0A0R2B2J2_SECCO|nr:citrate/2-methylcitrate synthase [Secundilactobacillus collinoides]KRM73290.1 methylcitrate synthase [Secundilactobacillus collinoides DSM 20515 = JCM 1123]KZL42451.1 methylcitrate synthase [Secundilactobacillus collinoides]
MALPKGLAGVVVDQTKISSTKNAILTYAGYRIEDLANASFEEVVYLLWYTRLPSPEELHNFKRTLVGHMNLPDETLRLMNEIAKEPQHPMSILRTTVSLLGTTNNVKRDDPPTILGKMLTAIAAIIRIRDGKPLLRAQPDWSVAKNFMYLFSGNEPTDEQAAMFNTVMVLHAEHEFNASTFTARVVASTQSDYYSCLTAAVCALKGPLHGGANERVFNMLETIRGQELAPTEYLKQELAAGHKVMGFGHRIYKNGDPRAKILRGIAEKLAAQTGNSDYYDLQATLADYMLKNKHLHPNVDYYTALIYHCLGLDKATFTMLFAACRTAGWLAHILEQQREGCLIRPSSEYVGPTNQHYFGNRRQTYDTQQNHVQFGEA